MAAGLQSMCQYWKEFDLQDLQRGLDTTATDLANRQDESDASRKRLVEQSRDFKKNTPEDIRKIVAPLLKSFQSEVDSLSKRSKASEAAFLTVYKKIIDLPDPVPVLEHAIQLQKKAQRVSDLEIENKQLRETLDEYNHEFAEVKNQEVTIKQLRDKLKELEDKIEATAEARAKEKERELYRGFGEKERQLQETQLSVAKKLGEAEQKVTTLHTALENVQSELFEVKSKYDEATSARSDEMDMVMADLERANERAAAAEREVDQLKIQLSSATSSLEKSTENMQKAPDMDKTIDMLTRSSLEVELAAKEKEISQLVEDVQRLQASLNKLRESTASQVLKLEEELSEKNKAFKILEERIKTQEDYEEIKRELNIMKSVEFSNETPDEDAKTKSLEVLLLEKNKSLQSTNTQLKVANTDVSESSTPALSENAEAFATMLGEEIAISYQQNNNSSSRMSTPSSTETTAESGKMSPPSSRPTIERSQSVSSDQHLPPPPSPQFYPYGNGHMVPNYIGLGNFKPDPNNSQGLDTTLVAKTVRELLSIHNIGQRLFAKHVLGLSQGTVSELLSKPKTWDKLTEKGRESYRKMYSWATDERNILALKAISPKKGSQPLVPNVQREDAHTEERIAHILSEAQQAMQAKKAIEQVSETQQQVAHAMVNSIYQQEMTRLAQVSGHQGLISPSSLISSPTITSSPNQPGRKHSHSEAMHHKNNVENQVSAKEMVERIYRQELMKLAQAAESAGNIAACTMYQQELARLAQNVHKEDQEPGEILRSRSSPEKLSVKAEPPDSTSDDANLQSNGPIDLSKHSSSAPTTPTSVGSDKSPTDSAHHPGSAFFVVKPTKVNGHDGFENNRFPPYTPSECISPLQRMQNIANSLMSRPHMGVASAKPLKAVLPPITQEEFDKFSNVNTEDLVKKIKDTLSQYSISQRLFGESVLGLSQGSVSDLLARPKPWHMLTQKGREPFIRMQNFLEDAEAIPKLVASQYHISPDKLMRSASMSGPEQGLPPDWNMVTPNGTSSINAQRRRRSSLDERVYDSPSAPKRPRVFFTEEQKDKLRLAYNQDPYPNQNTIEALANELNVGVKTVINWFHNHRMRAKQQQHAGNGGPGGGNGEIGNVTVKSEPTDDNSSHSDVSSMSGDVNHFHPGYPGNDSNQWLFPQFEPMSLQKRLSSGDKGEEGDEEDVEEDDEEVRSRCSASPKDRGGSLEETKETEDEDNKCSTETVFNDNNDDSGTEMSDEQSSLSNKALQNIPQPGVNKRKRSNPQYVSEGRHLDKTKNVSDDSLQSQISKDDIDNDDDTEKENEEVNGGGKRVRNDVIERVCKIEKLQKNIESTDDDWDEFDRSVSIEKLQKNIQQSSEEDWEF